MIVVDDEMSLPLIDPVVADMFPLVVNMFPVAISVALSDTSDKPFLILRDASIYTSL